MTTNIMANAEGTDFSTEKQQRSTAYMQGSKIEGMRLESKEENHS
jgi:hypothetical protein